MTPGATAMTPVEIVVRALCEAEGYRWQKDFNTKRAQAALDALTAAGWRPPLEPGFVAVPREATEAMQEAGSPWKYQLDCAWSAMIAASQSTTDKLNHKETTND